MSVLVAESVGVHQVGEALAALRSLLQFERQMSERFVHLFVACLDREQAADGNGVATEGGGGEEEEDGGGGDGGRRDEGEGEGGGVTSRDGIECSGGLGQCDNIMGMASSAFEPCLRVYSETLSQRMRNALGRCEDDRQLVEKHYNSAMTLLGLVRQAIERCQPEALLAFADHFTVVR